MTAALAFLSELCRLYLALLFGAACLAKARDLRSFRAVLEQLFGLGGRAGAAAALATIAAEGLVALALAAGQGWRRAGVAAAAVLLGAFTAVIVSALVRRTALRCNCFGGAGHVATPWDAARNAASLAGCAVAFAFSPPDHIPAAPHLLLLGNALILLLIAANVDSIAAATR